MSLCVFLYKLRDLPCYTEYRKREIKQNKKEKEKTKMKKFNEDAYLSEFEVQYLGVSRSSYKFPQHRNCRDYEGTDYYAEEYSEFYIEIYAEHIA